MKVSYSFVRCLISLFFRLFFRITIEGTENIPEENIILVANHYKIWDPLIIVLAIKRELSFMAKKELFENKFFARILKWVNAFPVDRKKADLTAIRNSVQIIKSGKNLLIFPEGTRVKEHRRSAMKEGVALIAGLSGGNILPITIHGSYRIFSRMTVNIKKCINIDEMKKREEKHLFRKKLLDEIYLSLYGEDGYNS